MQQSGRRGFVSKHGHPLKYVCSELFIKTGRVDKTTIIRLLYVNISVYIFRIGLKKAGFRFYTDKHMSL